MGKREIEMEEGITKTIFLSNFTSIKQLKAFIISKKISLKKLPEMKLSGSPTTNLDLVDLLN